MPRLVVRYATWQINHQDLCLQLEWPRLQTLATRCYANNNFIYGGIKDFGRVYIPMAIINYTTDTYCIKIQIECVI